MESEATDQFQSALALHISLLESLPEYPGSDALKRIVAILKTIKTTADLQQQKNLIDRIVVDGVENWETADQIGAF